MKYDFVILVVDEGYEHTLPGRIPRTPTLTDGKKNYYFFLPINCNALNYDGIFSGGIVVNEHSQVYVDGNYDGILPPEILMEVQLCTLKSFEL